MMSAPQTPVPPARIFRQFFGGVGVVGVFFVHFKIKTRFGAQIFQRPPPAHSCERAGAQLRYSDETTPS
jgi:hypothetical protein